MSKPIIECVPNFSEGRDRAVIDAIARAIRSVQDVALLDVDPGFDTNRTVYTFIGAPERVLEAAMAAAREARELIDMRNHRGAHPRIGALDVCPFVPVSGISMEDCAELARHFGRSLAQEFAVPVYLYERSASRPERQSLADIRAGEYEGLAQKLKDPDWEPDFGPATFDPRWGATVTGAREFLIAYNVNLNTKDKKLANDIALSVREAGRTTKDAYGNSVKVPGRLKAVRAIGWYIEEYRCAQVSINLLDFRTTALHRVFETVKEEAEARGLHVTGSELIGLIPLEAIRDAGQHFRVKMGKSPGLPDEELVELAVQTLGLRSVQPFDPGKKVIEWAFGPRGELVSMELRAFAASVSSDSPAPGGGSVAALAGALGASLAAMDANLSVGKKGREEFSESLSELSIRAQADQRELLALVDEDTAAFNGVMGAIRLPKSNEEEKLVRLAAIEAAEKRAAEVPLKTAELCLDAMELSLEAARRGIESSTTDAATGCLMAHAGLKSALMNVRVNIKSISDEAFIARAEAACASLEAKANHVVAALDPVVNSALAR